MKKTFTFLFCMAVNCCLFSQIADFENFNLGTDSFLNGSDGNGGFESGGYFFPNNYGVYGPYEFWDGWSISSMTDATTPGLGNQYSAITGAGADGSDTYAVSYVFGESVIKMHLMEDDFTFPMSMQVTNSTWAYFSMLEGDGIANKFGGLDGNAPDFFLLTIKGYVNGQLTSDSIDFYLADYRFDNNSLDYIVDEWTEIDLMPLGHVDSLAFTMNSSDTSSFGFNTPAYFCMDNLQLGIIENTNEELSNVDVQLFPNPTADVLFIDWNENLQAEAFIFSASGQLVKQIPLNHGTQKIVVEDFPGGMYYVKIQTDEGWAMRRFVKN
ncbi:MAG: DUF4465 domain-containing protein [Bacteroidota bacterium]